MKNYYPLSMGSMRLFTLTTVEENIEQMECVVKWNYSSPSHFSLRQAPA